MKQPTANKMDKISLLSLPAVVKVNIQLTLTINHRPMVMRKWLMVYWRLTLIMLCVQARSST